jgi:hypothetical protein
MTKGAQGDKNRAVIVVVVLRTREKSEMNHLTDEMKTRERKTGHE